MAVKIDFMKRVLLRALFFLIPFLWSIYVSAQPKQTDCNTTCFSSQVMSVEKLNSSCTAYEIQVSVSGECAHALSHYSVSVPCGKVQDIWNSQNWKQEIGTDPTAGINGFKIDDIAGFGDGALSSFTVKFTVCAEPGSCVTEMKCWQPVVAYKASTCVNYENLTVNCNTLTASIEKQNATCYGAADGSLSVAVTDGQGPYTFLWSNQSTQQTISGLRSGNYSVLIRDASGEELVLEETITQGEQIHISGMTSPATCIGVADGIIDLTVTGGTGPYSYVWSNGETTEDINELKAGQYSVVVTDSKNCTAGSNFNLGSSSTISINATNVKPDCNVANGSIDLTVIGGTSPYTFAWSTGQTTEDITNIGVGLYTVIVSDAAGCSQEKNIFISNNNTLSLKGTTTQAGCSDETTGAVDITVTGGSAPYTFTWSTGQTSEDATGLSSGYYTVTVRDAKGCTISGGYAVSKSTFQVARTISPPTCYGETNGSISIQEPVGGTAPFTYVWSDGQTGTSITDLEAGTYSVTITDAMGCSKTVSSTVLSPRQISVSALVSNINCNADGSFSIDLTPSGGTQPYTYQWSNGSTAEDLSGLAKGTYSVTITDAYGCSITKEIIVEGESATWSCLINEPSAASVCGTAENMINTAVIDADSYSWSVESTDGLWSLSGTNSPSVPYTAGGPNSSGTFTLTIVKDGCTKSCSFTVQACLPEGNGGGTDPGGEEPGGELPGGEDPDNGGSETCEECFSTSAKVIAASGSCRTYEMVVSTTGLCNQDLSHWTLAIPCGTISNYSNSESWAMEFGKDPTTGLYGLKVEGINSFGKIADAFTVRFTLCETDSCDPDGWTPTVSYKAGQCVGSEATSIEASATNQLVMVYPNPFSEMINFEWILPGADVNLEIIDQYGNTVARSSETHPENQFIRLDCSGLPHGIYYYRLTVDGRTYSGKVSKK